jgi:hypothetical protein
MIAAACAANGAIFLKIKTRNRCRSRATSAEHPAHRRFIFGISPAIGDEPRMFERRLKYHQPSAFSLQKGPMGEKGVRA